MFAIKTLSRNVLCNCEWKRREEERHDAFKIYPFQGYSMNNSTSFQEHIQTSNKFHRGPAIWKHSGGNNSEFFSSIFFKCTFIRNRYRLNSNYSWKVTLKFLKYQNQTNFLNEFSPFLKQCNNLYSNLALIMKHLCLNEEIYLRTEKNIPF